MHFTEIPFVETHCLKHILYVESIKSFSKIAGDECMYLEPKQSSLWSTQVNWEEPVCRVNVVEQRIMDDAGRQFIFSEMFGFD